MRASGGGALGPVLGHERGAAAAPNMEALIKAPAVAPHASTRGARSRTSTG